MINYFRYANEYNHAAYRHKYSKYPCPTYAFRFSVRFSGRFSGQVGGVSAGTVTNDQKTFLFISSAMTLNYEPEEEPAKAKR